MTDKILIVNPKKKKKNVLTFLKTGKLNYHPHSNKYNFKMQYLCRANYYKMSPWIYGYMIHTDNGIEPDIVT